MSKFNLNQIGQNGATNGQIPAWDNALGKWKPIDPPSGADGNGIYTGSGNIGANVGNSVTNATLPSGGSKFQFLWNNSNIALSISKPTNEIYIASPSGAGGVAQINDNYASLLFSSKQIKIDTNGVNLVGQSVVSEGTSTPNVSAILDLQSTSKAFYPPRMTTAQRAALNAADDAAIIYNTSTSTFDVRTGGGWASLATGAGGIYNGSGNIGNAVVGSTTTATIPSGSSTFKIAWSGGNSALLIDTNTFAGLYSPSGSFYTTVANSQAKIGYNSGEIVLNTSGLYYNNVALISTVGGAVDSNAILDLKSTTKVLFPPRMTEANKTALVAVSNGGLLYNTDSHKLNLRANGAWVDINTGISGIYQGSGTVPANVTATLTNNFYVNYNSANPALQVLDTNEGIGMYSGDDGAGNVGQGEIKTNTSGTQVFFDSKGLDINLSRSLFNNRTDFSVGVSLINNITPTALAANTDNYGPTGGSTSPTWRISSSSAVNITGITGGVDGRILTLHNIGSNTITLKNADSGSLAANRFAMAADLAIIAGMSVTLQYDSTSSNWRCIGVSYQAITSGTGGIYGGSGTVPAAVTATITGGSYFRFQYGSGTTRGFTMDDSLGSVILKSKTQTGGVGSQVSVENSQLVLYTKAGQKNMTMTDTTASWNLPNYFDPEGFLGYNNSAVLQIDSNLKGFLPPRMTATQRDAITTPAQGLVVYNTTADTISIKQAGGWLNIPTSAGGSGTVTTTGTPAANQVATFSGATSITGENELWYDTTNNRIGIGISSPTVVVHGAGAFEAKGAGNTGTSASAAVFRANNTTAVNTWYFHSRDDKSLIIESTDNPGAFKINAATDGGRYEFIAGMQYLASQDITIAANTNDWNVNKSTHVVRANVTAACNVTGMNNPANGRVVYIRNINSNNLTVKHEDAGSVATNRFALPLAADMTIRQNMCIGFWYDPTTQRWCPLSN